MSERKRDLLVERVVAAVADEHAFAVAHVPRFAGEVQVRRVVLQAQRDRLREPARRVRGTEQQVGDRTSRGLTGQPALQHRRRVLHPVGDGDRRAVGEHDHEARVRSGQPSEQLALDGGQVDIRAVEALRLVARRQPEERDHDIGVGRHSHGLIGELGVVADWSGSMVKPGAKTTSTPSGTPARSSSRATSTRVGLTCELPAPW